MRVIVLGVVFACAACGRAELAPDQGPVAREDSVIERPQQAPAPVTRPPQPAVPIPSLSDEDVLAQSELAQRLLNGTLEERRSAVGKLSAMDPASWSAELRDAAATTLGREGLVETSRDGIGESIIDLSRSVAALRDPVTIPALIRAVNTAAARRALTDFGEQAVGPLAEFILATDSEVHQSGGLTSFRCMVERAYDPPLTSKSRERIREVAEAEIMGRGARLPDPREATTLNSAIDLAAALKDPSLIRYIEGFAKDSSAVMARGISSSSAIGRVQKRAADRLAGVPAAPVC